MTVLVIPGSASGSAPHHRYLRLGNGREGKDETRAMKLAITSIVFISPSLSPYGRHKLFLVSIYEQVWRRRRRARGGQLQAS